MTPEMPFNLQSGDASRPGTTGGGGQAGLDVIVFTCFWVLSPAVWTGYATRDWSAAADWLLRALADVAVWKQKIRSANGGKESEEHGESVEGAGIGSSNV